MLDVWERIEAGLETKYDTFTGRPLAHTELWKHRSFKRRLKEVCKAGKASLSSSDMEDWSRCCTRIDTLSNHRNMIVHGRWIGLSDCRMRLGLPDDWLVANDIMRAWMYSNLTHDDVEKYVYEVERIRGLCIEMDRMVNELFLGKLP